MAWKDHLTHEETAELATAQRKRDEVREAYNKIYFKLKARADSRIHHAAKKATKE